MVERFDEMLEAITIAFVIGVSGWWIKYRFINWPKLDVSLRYCKASSSQGSGTKLTVTWHYKTVISNSTSTDAQEVENFYSSGPDVSVRGVNFVQAFDSVTVENKMMEDLEKAVIEEANQDLWGLIWPTVFEQFLLIIKYRNSARLPFYTVFCRRKGQGTVVKHTRWKPRVRTFQP